jgi:hypothetical protein
MINLGGNWDEVHWPDNWTATTVDGKRSAQFEETLLYVCHISRVPASIDRSSGSRKRVLKFLQQGSRGICSDITCSDDTGFYIILVLHQLGCCTGFLCDVGIVLVILGLVSFYYSTTCMGPGRVVVCRVNSVHRCETGCKALREKGTGIHGTSGRPIL